MTRAKLIFAGMVAVIAALAGSFLLGPGTSGDISVFCAAGMRLPVEAAAKRYEEEYGVRVHLQFDGSGTLLSKLEVTRSGDLYLAADTSYTDIAKEKGLLDETLPVASLTAGLGVAEGNPLGLSSLADLRDRKGLRIGLANPEAASVGKFTRKVLKAVGLWEAIEPRVTVFKPTVNEVANDLKLGTVDVGIIWDAVANQYPEIGFVNVPEFDRERKDVTVGVLRSTADPVAALRFARYLTAADRGLEHFKATGYDVGEGDRWALVPEINFYSGAMLRPAIEAKIRAFEKREGVKVATVYNGCGILVSQMKAGARPDAYFSCDISFMDDVEDLFGPSTLVSGNDMVILVANAARGKVTGPGDLAKPGLRLGVSHPEKSALGALTRRLFEALDLAGPVAASGNVAVESATGDFLVNQIRAGSLDAVIVYRSNARAHPKTLEECHIVEVDHPLATAHQPYALGKNSGHKQLLERLFRAVTSDSGRAAFESYGFRWEHGTGAAPAGGGAAAGR